MGSGGRASQRQMRTHGRCERRGLRGRVRCGSRTSPNGPISNLSTGLVTVRRPQRIEGSARLKSRPGPVAPGSPSIGEQSRRRTFLLQSTRTSRPGPITLRQQGNYLQAPTRGPTRKQPSLSGTATAQLAVTDLEVRENEDAGCLTQGRVPVSERVSVAPTRRDSQSEVATAQLA